MNFRCSIFDFRFVLALALTLAVFGASAAEFDSRIATEDAEGRTYFRTINITPFGATFLGAADAAEARGELGLAGAATLSVGTTEGTVAAGDDSRLVNAVQTTGSYGDPSWLTSLHWSKIANTPTSLSGYGITDAQPAIQFVAAPAGPTDTGTQGTMIVSGNYLYICVATDTWLRAQLLAWDE